MTAITDCTGMGLVRWRGWCGGRIAQDCEWEGAETYFAGMEPRSGEEGGG